MLDLFFDKQPPRAFEKDLREYETPNIKKHACDAESVSVDGLNLDFGQFAKEKVLSTSFDRLSRVLKANSLLGGGYNLKVKKDEKLKSEEFIFDARKDCCVISAGTVDGVRRGLIYFEDLLVVGGGNLKLGRIFIKPKIELRLARCFFAPINRPPKNLAELDDEIDYYPDAYLDRLMHDGANAVWVYADLDNLVKSSYITEFGVENEKRIKKLNL
jgi:hypothetical protein